MALYAAHSPRQTLTPAGARATAAWVALVPADAGAMVVARDVARTVAVARTRAVDRVFRDLPAVCIESPREFDRAVCSQPHNARLPSPGLAPVISRTSPTLGRGGGGGERRR